jgi:hypothetical protein
VSKPANPYETSRREETGFPFDRRVGNKGGTLANRLRAMVVEKR